jgi:hypothetical protein
LAAAILPFTSSSWASGLVLQRMYCGTTHSQQGVQGAKCGRCNFLSCTKHDRFYPHCFLQAWQCASHTATLAWHRVICERDVQPNRVVCKPKMFFRPMGLLDWWFEFFLDNLSELMVNV